VLAPTKLVGFDERSTDRDNFVVVHPPLATVTAEIRRRHTGIIPAVTTVSQSSGHGLAS
jgi:hypothetical protein